MWRGRGRCNNVVLLWGAFANVSVIVRKWVVFLVVVMTMCLASVLLLVFAGCMDKMLSVSVANVGGRR